MGLDAASGMNEILDTLLGYNSDVDINLGGYENNVLSWAQ